MLQNLKDRALAWAFTRFVEPRIEPYGKLVSLSFDSNVRQMNARLLLKGEREPVDVILLGYRIEDRDGGLFLAFHSLETSRGWLNQLLQDLLPDNLVRLPPQTRRYSNLIRMLM